MAVSSADFEAYRFSSKMGPQLRKVVEDQLREDLSHYGIAHTELLFDWSNSCLEGHDAAWLDGHLENFSDVALLDTQGQTIVEGWMEFMLEGELLLIYWDNLTSWDSFGKHLHKEEFGIPPHVWNRIPLSSQSNHMPYLMRTPPFI